jgi:ribonuclease HI
MRYGDRLKECSGFDPATTNNKMELSAVIEALSFLATRRGEVLPSSPSWLHSPIIVFTDSQYVKNGITKWIRVWKAKGWKTSNKEPVKNRDLWERLDALTEVLKPEFRWVEGHAGVEDNERCDRLVRQAMESRKPLS